MPEEIRPEELIKWEEENRPFINAYAKAISAGNQMHTEAYQNWVKMQEENFKKYFDEQSKAHKQSIDNWYETRRRSIMEQFERSKNYTNLIVIAGYAGYFWMLEKFRDDMDQRLVMWSGLMVIISLAIFVFSEIFVMWASAKKDSKHFEFNDHRKYDLISEPKRFDRIESRYHRLVQGVWVYHFWPAVLFGLGAFYFLFEFFIREVIFK